MQDRKITAGSGTRAVQTALVFLFSLIVLSCSPATRKLFFDIRPPTAEELAEKARQDVTPAEATTRPVDTKIILPGDQEGSLPRPAIELVSDWKAAMEMLPKAGREIDWMAALEMGVIRPRNGSDPMARYAAIFQYDFIISGEDSDNDVLFPHSAHTQWLGCKNCHTAIYPYKRNPSTMKEMKKGASCGTCHGRKNVAFSLRSCGRCHPNM